MIGLYANVISQNFPILGWGAETVRNEIDFGSLKTRQFVSSWGVVNCLVPDV
uniref:Uncharacterized protein n=1 Tax=Arundo donax TaxID=35708 RepID=A0A0A9A3F3_ARUDO